MTGTTMHRTRAVILLAALGTAAATAGADQADPTDVRSKSGVQLDLNLPKGWSAGLEVQHRRVDDLSTSRGMYITIEGGYRLHEHVTALAYYKRAATNEGSGNRYAGGLHLEAKLDRLRLSFRPLLQHNTPLVDDGDTGGDGRSYLRTRLRAEVPLTKHLDLYAYVEPVFALGADHPVDNWRDTLGVQYQLTKWIGAEAYYTYRPDYGKSYDRTFHVFGFSVRLKAKVGARRRGTTGRQ
jgi:hypothetical protein